MRLLTLKLENWRGVSRREIEFAPGVTVIEGPNEIGKSTIVEALQVLFGDLDSNKSQRIKAIAPVGQDVGSTVEATLKVGEHHLAYAKTYNKKTATVLSVTGAQTLQLSGREAHEWVAEFLAAQVDMNLWRALLVDQSDTLGKANLQSSQGLAQALDEAAGNGSSEGNTDSNIEDRVEDTTLYTAVLAEYEQYFTLKTGKPKAVILELEKRVAQSKEALAQAQAALQAVAADTQDQEARAAEVLRLQNQLPALQEQVQKQELAWAELSSLQELQQTKQQELDLAKTRLQELQQSLDSRQRLAADIRSSSAKVTHEEELGAPLQSQTEGLKRQLLASRETLNQLRVGLEQGRIEANLAAADAQHFANQKKRLELESNLAALHSLEVQMSEHLKVTKATKIKDAVVEQFRVAETALAVVEAQRDTAATTLELLAHSELTVRLNDHEVVLQAGQKTEAVVAKKLVLDLPGTAQVVLTPSASVADIQDALNLAQANLAELSATYDVTGSGPAQQINAQRNQAQMELDKLGAQRQQLLSDSSEVELKHDLSSLKAAASKFLEQRPSTRDLPTNAAQAQVALERSQETLLQLEKKLEQQRQHEEKQRSEYDELDASYRLVQQNLEGLSATLAEKQNRLAQDRKTISDETMQMAVEAQQAVVVQINTAVSELHSTWQAANPDAVLELRDNARLVFTRASADLAKNQSLLDVLTDRLQQAQADGRFDTAAYAASLHTQLEHDQQALQRRAAAAKHLWVRLNEHRSQSRQAYVEPLKRAVESLGAIVFGSGFEVELDENWALVSRTLHGKTLPFSALSIGAKEQLGILLRLAAGQVTAGQGGVPLIIDDALGFSDPTRLATMGAAIAAAGRKAQVIILTCTPGRFTHVGNAKVVVLDQG